MNLMLMIKQQKKAYFSKFHLGQIVHFEHFYDLPDDTEVIVKACTQRLQLVWLDATAWTDRQMHTHIDKQVITAVSYST